MSQLAFLLLTTKPNSDLSIIKTVELVLCSMTLVAGLMIILRSATKITHRAQGITSLAATWHACATIDSYDVTSEAQIPRSASGAFSDASKIDSDEDEGEYEEDDVDTAKFLPAYANSSISFQKRQALVTYFENNRAGITMYGFTLDRTWLQLIFGIELSLVLWLLKETIKIS